MATVHRNPASSLSIVFKAARFIHSFSRTPSSQPPSPPSPPPPSPPPSSSSPPRAASHDSESSRGCRSSSPAPASSSGHSSGRPRTPSPGVFQNAQHFVINNGTFQDITYVQPYLNYVLERLGQHTFGDSRFDVIEECHPETRERIMTLSRNFYIRRRCKRMLWLSGPAGVGKTSIMRSIGDAKDLRLGAKLFFSRRNECTDPRSFVQTIAYQLAVRIPIYQQYVAYQLHDDPRILENGMKELFRRLIEEPIGRWAIFGGTEPWMILIDGLDECDGEGAQSEIVKMIGAFVQQYPASPIVWIIASRPEWWLKAAFTRPELQTSCLQEHIEIDTPEARRDVDIYIRSEFKKIRDAFSHQFLPDQDWPTERQIQGLSKPASGLFLFASTASRFVADPKVGNPASQLSTLLTVIGREGGSVSQKENPLSPLHDLYARVLDTVPQTNIEVTKRILGCCQLLPRNTIHSTSFVLSCNLLDIPQNDAYASIQQLHSVLDVPSSADALTRDVRILHSSFAEFLTNSTVSQGYYVSRQEAGANIVRCSFRILQEANKCAGPLPQLSNISLAWPHQEPEKTREMLLQTAYDGFRLLTVFDPVADELCSLLLAQADFSKLDCYMNPSAKTSVHKVRGNHLSLFEWLIEKWKSSRNSFKNYVKEVPLSQVGVRHIRCDRAIVHLRFTLEGNYVVVRPKVYSDSEDIQRKYHGESLEPFKDILRARRSDSPIAKVQLWGSERAKRCLLFQYDPVERGRRADTSTIKEIFFIPCYATSTLLTN